MVLASLAATKQNILVHSVVALSIITILFVLFFSVVSKPKLVEETFGDRAANAERLARILQCWSKNGSWEYTESARYDPVLKVKPASDYCAIQQDQRWEAGLVWQPDEVCNDIWSWERLSASQFCKLLNGRNFLAVGDSLTMQMFDGFDKRMSLSGESGRADIPEIPLKSGVTHDAYHGTYLNTYCSNTTYRNSTFNWFRNDLLSWKEETTMIRTITDEVHHEFAWLPYVKQHNYSIIVLNRGAHFKPDAETIIEYNQTLAWFTSHFPRAIIMVRGTVPGHPNCEQYRNKPPTKIHEDPKTLPYNWGLFEHQNTLISQLIHQHFFPQVVFLDVSATNDRRDSHASSTDCLHYCWPGPYDFWIDMVYNVAQAYVRLFGPLQ